MAKALRLDERQREADSSSNNPTPDIRVPPEGF